MNAWLRVGRGDFVTLINHTGCSKTTILDILSGFEASLRTTAGARPAFWGGRQVPDVRPANIILEETSA